MYRDNNLSMRKPGKAADIIFILLFILLAAAACFIFIQCTPSGVGLVSDSVNYINGARSIAAGKGYYRESGGGMYKPITNFPPLYSIVLSIPMKFGLDWDAASWWVSLIFFVLNTVLIIRLIWLASGSRWAGLLGALLFLCMQPYLFYQFYAMSEPVYYFCTLLAFIFMLRGFRSGNFFWWLGCGLACGGAFLARYIGIVSLCAIFGGILVFLHAKRGKAFAGLFTGSLPLIAAWLVRNALSTGNASNRQILSHWVTLDDLRHGVMIFWRWIWPQRYGNMEFPTAWMVWGIFGFLTASVVFCIVSMIMSTKREKSFSLSTVSIWTFLLFSTGYLLFVVLTISLFDASVNIEERILFPAFMILWMILPILCGHLLHIREYIPALLPVFLIVFFAVIFGIDSYAHHNGMAEHGYGWGWDGWNESPAMQIIRELPEDKLIYTNQIEAVSLWAGRGSFALLDPIDPSSEQEREGYWDTMSGIQRQVIDGRAVLVFFGIQDWLEPGKENWIDRLCDGLPTIYRDSSEWVVGKK